VLRAKAKSNRYKIRLAAECTEREILDDDANRAPVATDKDSETIDVAGEKDDVKVTKTLGYNRFMIDSVWKHGQIQLTANDVRKVRIYHVKEKDCRRFSFQEREKCTPTTLNPLCNGTILSLL